MMGKKIYGKFAHIIGEYMQKYNFQDFYQMSELGVHSTTCDPELRYERFALTSFMGFPAILNALQPFQICISNRKNTNLTFSNDSQLMQKGLWQICTYYWRAQAKKRISKISTRCQNWGVHSTTCDPELRNESCALISFMGFPAILSALQPFQICISNRKNTKLTFSNDSQLMQKGLWQNCMYHWRVHAKKEFPRFPPDVRTGGSTPQLVILNSEMKVVHWYLLWGFLQY